MILWICKPLNSLHNVWWCNVWKYFFILHNQNIDYEITFCINNFSNIPKVCFIALSNEISNFSFFRRCSKTCHLKVTDFKSVWKWITSPYHPVLDACFRSWDIEVYMGCWQQKCSVEKTSQPAATLLMLSNWWMWQLIKNFWM